MVLGGGGAPFHERGTPVALPHSGWLTSKSLYRGTALWPRLWHTANGSASSVSSMVPISQGKRFNLNLSGDEVFYTA